MSFATGERSAAVFWFEKGRFGAVGKWETCLWFSTFPSPSSPELRECGNLVDVVTTMGRRLRKLLDAKAPGQPGDEETNDLESGATHVLAKSRDPDFTKLTAYIRRDLHVEFKIALMRRGQEISDVISQFVAEWLQKEGAK